MTRVYSFVPTINNHRVEKMPHLVSMLTLGSPDQAKHLVAARGVMIGVAICASFWILAVSAIW